MLPVCGEFTWLDVFNLVQLVYTVIALIETCVVLFLFFNKVTLALALALALALDETRTRTRTRTSSSCSPRSRTYCRYGSCGPSASSKQSSRVARSPPTRPGQEDIPPRPSRCKMTSAGRTHARAAAAALARLGWALTLTPTLTPTLTSTLTLTLTTNPNPDPDH